MQNSLHRDVSRENASSVRGISFLSSLKCILVCFTVAFFIFAENTQAQTTDCSNITATGVPQAECQALVDLYNQTDGANWTINTNWNSAEPIGEWYGVTVLGGYVTQLNLAKNNLTGTIPASLGNLTSLDFLWLWDNELSGPIPDLSGSPNLGSLDLARNRLTGTMPTWLGDLTSLYHLDLSYNDLSGPIPTELFKGLTALQALYLRSNRWSPGPIPDLSESPNLGTLVLSQGNLTGEIPTWLGDLAFLQNLSLWGNELSGEIPDLSKSKSHLGILVLSQNNLTGTIPDWLDGLASFFVELDLSDNMLTGEIPTGLGSLIGLKYLSLSRNQLTGSIPTELGNLTNLQYLYLWDNELSGSIPTELGNLTNLLELSLSLNQLSGSIPPQLGDLVRLTLLYLRDNKLTGTIPIKLRDLTQLREVIFSQNQLTGEIPDLSALMDLEQLYLNNNQLTGSVPVTQLEDLASASANLLELALWGNEGLTWDIPDELGKRVDRAALRTFYQDNGGSDWRNSTNWLDMDNPFSFSDWYGVRADATTGRVSALNLGNNGLKEEITNALEALDGLKELNISYNRQLTGELPLRLMALPVERLDIRCTDVSTPADTNFEMWLSGISFQVVCPPPPPPPPPPQPAEQIMGVEVMAGVEQLLVQWDPVSEADGYKIQWKSGSQQFDSSRQHITSASTTSYTISNLDAEREYVVRVIATKSGAADATPSPEVAGTPSVADMTPPPQQPTTTGQGGGGCSIASNAGTGNTPESIVFNLLLVVFVLVSVVFPEKGSEQSSCVLQEIP